MRQREGMTGREAGRVRASEEALGAAPGRAAGWRRESSENPLIGREVELEHIERIATSRTAGGLILIGRQGAGKSALLRHAGLAAAGPVRWVRGDVHLREVPYGALAWLFDAQDAATAGVPRLHETSGENASAQFAALAALHPLVIVDAVELPDSASVDLLAHFASSGGLTLLCSARSSRHLPAQLADLAFDRTLDLIELPPLGEAEMAVCIERELRGPVSTRLIDVLLDAGGGLPGRLHALLEAARAAGQIVNRDGVWMAPRASADQLDEFDEYLRQGVDELPADQQAVLEILALSGGLTADALIELGVAEVAEALLRMGIVEAGAEGEVLSISDALLARAIARAVPPGRRRALLEGPAGRPPSDPRTTRAEHWLLWRQSSRLAVDAQFAVEGARAAHARGRVAAAARIYSGLWPSELGAEGLVEFAHVLCDLGKPQLGLDIIDCIQTRTADPVHLLFAARVSMQAHALLGSAGSQLRAALTRGTARLVDGEPWSAETRQVITALAELTEHGVMRAGALGGLETAQLGAAGAPAGLVDMVVALRAWEAYGQGDARPLMDLGAGASHTEPCGFATDLVRLMLPLSLLGRGAADAAVAATTWTRGADPVLAFSDSPYVDIVRAVARTLRGDAAGGLELARTAATTAVQRQDYAHSPQVLGVTAYLAAAAGDRATVVTCAGRFGLAQPNLAISQWWVARAEIAVALELVGESSSAESVLTETVAQARAAGRIDAEVQLRLVGASLGWVPEPARMVEVGAAARTQGGGTLAFLGRALLAGDSEALIRYAVSRSSVRPLMAAVCAKLAAGVDPRLDASEVFEVRSGGNGGQDAEFSDLSAREAQVRELIVAELSNAEIAERLGLRVRTVEGHVYRLFRKLGVTRRSEIAALSRQHRWYRKM